MKKPRVLFLGTRNAVRSQMAEALLRHHAGDRFEVYSAGLEPTELHPHTIMVLEEAGITMAGQQAKNVSDFLGRLHFGYLITVCPRAESNCPVFPGLSQRISWSDLEDPEKFEGPADAHLDKFRQVRDQINDRIHTWLDIVSSEQWQ